MHAIVDNEVPLEDNGEANRFGLELPEKQEAKKQFKRFALSAIVEANTEQCFRSIGILDFFGASLWYDDQKSLGDLILAARSSKKRILPPV